jgi:amidase
MLGSGIGARHAAAQTPFEWEEATIAELQAAMESGALSSLALTRAYLERMAAIDLAGPQLNSIIETNPDVEAIASALDQERAAGLVRGPLHGIPIVLKDNIATDDRMQTAAGSLALVGSKVPRDAGVAARLRDAGAILLGKSNMSEFAGFRGWPNTAGWSARAGIGQNPYALGYSCGHSSSGSAAAASANLTVGGVGTETYGSIIMSASLCGVVGLKPTLGLTSRSGVIPISFTRDVTGPMGRTVADVATMLGGMVGVDPLDPATEASAGRFRTDYRTYLDPDGLRGARLGWWQPDRLFTNSSQAQAVTERAVERLRGLGATVLENIEMSWESIGDHVLVMFYEFEAGIDAYLSGLSSSPVRTLRDVVAFNREHADSELRWFNQDFLTSSLGSKRLPNPEYLRAVRDSRTRARRAFSEAMRRHRLDAIIVTTFREPWAIDLLNADIYTGNGCAGVHNAAGYPNITVPAGYAGPFPIGLSFMAEAWSEPKLFRLAYAFEQGDPVRRVPQLLEGWGEREFVQR